MKYIGDRTQAERAFNLLQEYCMSVLRKAKGRDRDRYRATIDHRKNPNLRPLMSARSRSEMF